MRSAKARVVAAVIASALAVSGLSVIVLVTRSLKVDALYRQQLARRLPTYFLQPARQAAPGRRMQPATSAVRALAISVVQRQLNSLRDGEFDSAADDMYAPEWHTQAGHVRFRITWTASYPEIIDYRRATFGRAEWAGPFLGLYATVFGKNGREVQPVYVLVNAGTSLAIGQVLDGSGLVQVEHAKSRDARSQS